MYIHKHYETVRTIPATETMNSEELKVSQIKPQNEEEFF